MIVLDTSAVMAILLRESDARVFADAIAASPRVFMSSGTLLELNIVATKLREAPGAADAQQFIGESAVEIVPFGAAQAQVASDAYRLYGKGRNRAGLNFGDCFAYALAKSRNLPLLFKGDDFTKTDVQVWRA